MYRPPPSLSSSRPDPRVSPPHHYVSLSSSRASFLTSFKTRMTRSTKHCDNNSVNKKTRTVGKSGENTRAKIAWPKNKTHHRVRELPFLNPGHGDFHDPQLSVFEDVTRTHADPSSLQSSSNFVHLLLFPVLFGSSEIKTTS